MREGIQITKLLRVTEEMRAEDPRIHAHEATSINKTKRNRAIVEAFAHKLIDAAGASQTKKITLKPIKALVAEEFYLEVGNTARIVTPYIQYHRGKQEAAKNGSKPLSATDATGLVGIAGRLQLQEDIIDRLGETVKALRDQQGALTRRVFDLESLREFDGKETHTNTPHN